MILANMTSPDVDALSRDLLVIIPVASLEQHSLHLPVFTDTMILQEVVNRIEKRLSRGCAYSPGYVAGVFAASHEISRYGFCVVRDTSGDYERYARLYD